MRIQKYEEGDSVRIAENLGMSMRHFPKGCDGRIIGSYRDLYGCVAWDDTREPIYAINIHSHGHVAWYNESQLTLISEGTYE